MDLPEMIGGKYRPCGVLGTGATGTVYRVEHAFTGDLLALKVMNAHLTASPDAIARFKREARTASKIRSQHVVRVFDADVAPELGGVPYMVMDLLEGSDLEKISHERAVAPDEVVEWLRQVASPLDKAHRLGIIHRDLKPENLFLTKHDDGTPIIKILDFGIAKIETESAGITQLGQVFGTPLYMAPEQARGEPSQIGPATDLFALGQIAYRLLTGAAYRTDAPFPQVLNQILTERLETPSQRGYAFGDDFDQWFLRACALEPSRRFGSACEQIEALAQALGIAVDLKPVSGPVSSPRARDSLPFGTRDSVPYSARDSLPSGARSSQPDGRGRLPTDPLGLVEPKTPVVDLGPGTPTLPGVGGSEIAARPGSKRLAFAAAALLFGMALVVFAFARNAPRIGVGGAVTKMSATQGGTGPVEPGAPIATASRPPAAQDAVALPTPSAPPASPDANRVATLAARPASADRPTPRWYVPRTTPAAATTSTASRKNALDDDPLSDQK